MKKPRVLFLDIETFYLSLNGWGLFDQNFALNQVEKDWSIASWAAKWQGSDEIFYEDVSKQANKRNDRAILKGIWRLLDEADVVVGQNSKRFDVKKLNARFILNGMKPPSPYRQIDTLQMAKKSFGFTSNKLEYLSAKLAPGAKKSAHKSFPGFELWKECLAGNQKAWREMKKYNIQDVVALESVYNALQPWGTGVNLNVYSNETTDPCNCGSIEFQRRGFMYTATGRFQKFQCKGCGAWHSSKKNTLTKDKRASMKKAV